MEALLRPLKAAADANRLRIVRALGRGPFNVAELTEILGVGQSTVSRHLRLLSEAGLVEVRRSGTWAFYSLRGEGGGGLAGDLLALLREPLRREADPDAAAVERVLARRRRATSEFFRRAARHWDRVRDEVLGPPEHLERLVELAGGGGTVVDLGTGTGVLLERLAGAAARVIGVDASPEMLEEAGRRAARARLRNTDLRLGALEHLPLRDGEADTMIANLVLHHVADPRAVLREIRRGLAPGGRLVIAELAEHDDESFWKRLGARWPGFRPDELGGWLSAAGFEKVRIEEGDGKRPAAPPARPRLFLIEARRGRGPGRAGAQRTEDSFNPRRSG